MRKRCSKIDQREITDDALQARYEKTVGSFPTTEEVRARHILVKTEAEADAIIKDLAGGADFAKIAAEKSIGPSKTRGGDLDYFGKGQMVPPFEKAAFASRQEGSSPRKPCGRPSAGT